MLNFVKEILLVLQGIDISKIYEEKNQKKENYHLLSKSSKIVIYLFCFIFIILEILNILVVWKLKDIINFRLKGIILITIDCLILFYLRKKNERSERLVIILSVVFLIIMFSSTMVLSWF